MINFHKGHCALGVLSITLAWTCVWFWLNWSLMAVSVRIYCPPADQRGIDPFPASTGGGRPRDARVAGAFGSGLFWRFGFYIWTWIIKPVPWKSSASRVLYVCVRVSQAGMQLNRPKSAHLISSSPHNSSSYSSQFNSMRFSYHISSGLSSPQPALRRSGESGADALSDVCAISVSFQFQRFACSAAKASLQRTEVTLMYANADVSVTNKHDRKEKKKSSLMFQLLGKVLFGMLMFENVCWFSSKDSKDFYLFQIYFL